jgi:PKD repeat protein
MKKINTFLIAMAFGIFSIYAKPVTSDVAKTVATSFYSQNSAISINALTLAYTESASGQPVYYVFNVNTSDGFVIVSAEDATHPVLGYSAKGQYVIPAKGTNIEFWMRAKKNQILSIRSKGYTASPAIADEWNSYMHNQKPRTLHAQTPVVLPLCQTTWDQPYPYNAMCPGGSVTGCVATAMAQIMKYWDYPAHGLNSSCYNDSPPNYTDSWGTLCAYYDTTNYPWSSMPNSVTSLNNGVAELIYDCGVSVDMNYTPSGSGAYVITADNPICAQASYVNYFGYNPSTIAGVYRTAYATSTWISMIENELNNQRPVQYAGADVIYGGHTWVCDGYDAINDFHMNWGWSGTDDGYYNIDSLTPSPYDFSVDEELLYGIEPPNLLALFTATPTAGNAGMTVYFTDKSLVPSLSHPITAWSWTFPGGTPATSNLQNPVIVYNAPGTYPVTLQVTNNLGSNSLTKTTYISVYSSNSTCITLVSDATAGPDIDATIDTQYPGTNYATTPDFSSETWTCGGPLCLGRSLIRFDLSSIPAGSTIVSSNLYLYANLTSTNGIPGSPTYGTDNAAWVKRITAPWTVSGVTWNNQPTTTDSDRAVIPESTNTAENYNINVTQLVIDMLATNNYGLEIMDTNEVNYYNSLIFGSGNNADTNTHPRLQICYLPPSNSNCITIVPDDSTQGVDCEIANDYPNTSFPSVPDFMGEIWTCGGVPCTGRALMNPNLSAIPAGAIIDSAWLYLYANTTSSNGYLGQPTYGTDNKAWLQRITAPWDFRTVTWNNPPVITTVDEVSIPQSTAPAENYALNVTQLIKDIISSGNNYGFMMRDSNEAVWYNSLIFCSDNNADTAEHPKLDVCYHMPSGIAPVINTPQIVVYPNPATDKVVFKTSLDDMDNTHVDIYNSIGATGT